MLCLRYHKKIVVQKKVISSLQAQKNKDLILWQIPEKRFYSISNRYKLEDYHGLYKAISMAYS